MLSEREIMIAWLEAMEEIDELEVEFWEILRGNDAKNETKNETNAPANDTSARGTRTTVAPGDYS